MANTGSAVPKEPVSETIEEPSMDDIMASIRQIIAEDEQSDGDGESARDRYTHPTDVSNVNEETDAAAYVDEGELLASMEQEMQAVVEDQVAAQMEAPLAAPVQAVANGEVAPQADVPEVTADSSAALASGVGLAAAAASIHERAEQVRTEMGLSSVDANGLTLEQRLEKYRVRGRRQEEIEKAREEERKTERQAEAAAVQRLVDAMPAPVQQSIAPVDVAKSLMNESAGTISADLTEIMRPVVREWLSENLPGMVERLVREEIERVSRGRKLQ